ncbi:hypothetical protein ACPSL3_09775 [Vibrio owensii]|uniref:hypothetical protein n=1 Tax=Vibrio owensii TaxID=696485 RepID=UPI003CE52240
MKRLRFALLSFFACFPVFSAEKMHKDWVIDTSGSDYFYAATINNSGHIFGKYCYFDDQQCFFLLGIDINCKTGNKYPILVNAESGALNMNLVCGDKVGKHQVLTFDNFDEIERTAKESNKLGVAIPMESGQFKVSRFSMSGSTYSLETMTDEAIKHSATINVDSELL